MDKLDLIMTIMIAGFGLIFSIMLIMWNNMNKRFDKIDEKFEKTDIRFNHVENRLTAIETILHMKECCMIKDERKLPKTG